MNPDHRPYVPEQLPPVTITDQAESDYFRNLSNRLLSRVAEIMVILPPAAVIMGGLINAGAQQADLAITMPTPGVYGLNGVVLAAILSAREIWKVRNERFPR